MVRLKVLLRLCQYQMCLHFNSTMVRLKDYTEGRLLSRQRYFNSTMVRLKDYAGRIMEDKRNDFNSTMVRLKDQSDLFNNWINTEISIPLWYD